MTDLAVQLEQLLATARRVAESLELDTVLGSIVRDATTLLGGDSGDMLLWDRETERLAVAAVWNFPPDMLEYEMAFGEGISTQAILTRQAVVVDDYAAYEHRAPGLERFHFGAVMCAPLIFRGDAIGSINVHAWSGGHRFAPGAADLLAAFAGHAAIAIDHARRFENEVRLGRELAETNRALTRSLTVQQRLAEQVLLDGGPAGIAQVLADHLERRVVIQDHLHRLIAGAAPGGGNDWRALLGAADGGWGVPDRGPYAVAVRMGPEVVGHLVLSADDDLGPIDRALVDVATTGVALEFAKLRAAVEVESRLRGEAVTDLLVGSYVDEDAVAARAARLGYDLARPRDLLVIGLDGIEPTGGVGEQRPIMDVVHDHLATRDPQDIAVWHGGAIVVLAVPGRPAGSDARSLATDLRSLIDGVAANVPGMTTAAIGIADRCSRPDDYAPAYRHAREAVELMTRLGRRGAIVTTDELGPYGLLLRASSRDDLDAFASRTLGPLTAYDRLHGGDLVRTLRAYIEEDRVQRRVAARCFVHVNTVVYRLRRISELLAVDLGDPRVIFDLTLALRISDLIDEPATAV